ncbi:MAG: cobyric acid synthase CobQ, partial [Ruminiclostridium sp.]|nr:cobyric acid synthase CobQ [Ruminiclostridium sp.]
DAGKDEDDLMDFADKALYEAKGLKFNGTVTDRKIQREKELDKLADAVRKSLNMDMIYKIIQEGV